MQKPGAQPICVATERCPQEVKESNLAKQLLRLLSKYRLGCESVTGSKSQRPPFMLQSQNRNAEVKPSVNVSTNTEKSPHILNL